MDTDGPSFLTIAPVLPVRDFAEAINHYTRLGFDVAEYEGGGYAFAKRGEVWLHLESAPGLDPDAQGAICYLYVSDADAVYAEWRDCGALGVLMPANDTDFGLREFAHFDPDGNLLRVGSWIIPRH
ncbi:MAG TPA: VOC family protein [Ilumatobacteraceae bacterium]|jgi:predicted enzyme related to lactoylglutathione lyase